MKNPFKYRSLASATWDEWEDFKKELRENAPIVYFWREKIRPFFKYRAFRRIKDAKWAFKHRFVPRHQYNIVRTQLPPGYYDVDMRMMYACFALLVDYVEIEMSWGSKKYRDREKGLENLDATINHNANLPDNHDIWDRMPDHQEHAAREAKELYLWWEKYKDDDDSEYEGCPVSVENGLEILSEQWRKDHPVEYTEWQIWADNAHVETERKKAEADEMLMRLIKIRHSLWT
jgi:hypothetical protein